MMDKILPLGNCQTFGHDSILFEKGKKVKNVLYIKAGTIRLYDEDSGDFLFVDQGTFLGLVETYTDKIYKVTGSVVGRAEVVEIEVGKFKKIFDEDRYLRSFIIRNLSLEMFFE